MLGFAGMESVLLGRGNNAVPRQARCTALPAGAKREDLTRRGIPVFTRHQQIGEGDRPIYHLDEIEAAEMIRRGKCIRIGRRGRALRLLSDYTPGRRDSLFMGPSVIQGFAAGDQWAADIIEEIKPKTVNSKK